MTWSRADRKVLGETRMHKPVLDVGEVQLAGALPGYAVVRAGESGRLRSVRSPRTGRGERWWRWQLEHQVLRLPGRPSTRRTRLDRAQEPAAQGTRNSG